MLGFNLKQMLSSVSAVVGLLISSTQFAMANDLVSGSLDSFSKEEIVVGDEAYAVSKLVTCYDQSKRRMVGCAGLNRAKWVSVSFEDDSRVVLKVQVITEAQYKGLQNDD